MYAAVKRIVCPTNRRVCIVPIGNIIENPSRNPTRFPVEPSK